jgi:hypothetical protein
MKYKESPIVAKSIAKEDHHITYTFDTPRGVVFVRPIFNPRHTVRLESIGPHSFRGGEAELHFRMDSYVPRTDQEYPKVGEVIATLVTLSAESPKPTPRRGNQRGKSGTQK